MKEVVAKSKGHYRHRLQHIYDICKTKSVCEGDDPAEKKLAIGEEDLIKPVSNVLSMLSVHMCVVCSCTMTTIMLMYSIFVTFN